VQKPSRPQRSPATGLLLGLVITLAVLWRIPRTFACSSPVCANCRATWWIEPQRFAPIAALAERSEHCGIGDARHAGCGRALPAARLSAQFERVRGDLDSALRLEEQYAEVHRTPEQRAYLSQQLSQFWMRWTACFAGARRKRNGSARPNPAFLASSASGAEHRVSRLLVENNEGEQQALPKSQKFTTAYNGSCIFF